MEKCKHIFIDEDIIIIKSDGMPYKLCYKCNEYILDKNSKIFLSQVAEERKNATY